MSKMEVKIFTKIIKPKRGFWPRSATIIWLWFRSRNQSMASLKTRHRN